MHIQSTKTVDGKSQGGRLLCLELQDIKELSRLPDAQVKIALAVLYKHTMKPDEIKQVTGCSDEQLTGFDPQLNSTLPFFKKKEESGKKRATEKEEKVFDPEVELNKLASSEQVWQRVIALYWVVKGFTITEKQHYKMLMSPLNIKKARELADVYDMATIKKAMLKTQEVSRQKNFEWDIKTVIPFANKLANS